MRDHAHTLSDFRVPTLSIECAPCGRFGRYNIARLIERSFSVYDQCKIMYGEDSLAPTICERSTSLPRGARFADLMTKRN